MRRDLFGGVTTLFISTGIILIIALVGIFAFNIAAELEKGKQLAGLSPTGEFDPNRWPASGAGIPGQDQSNGLDCNGVIFRAADNGIRYVRESGGGRYYAAEVEKLFGIYTLYYDHLVKIENSSLDIHTYRKLKHALYHCDGAFTQSTLHIAYASPDSTRT